MTNSNMASSMSSRRPKTFRTKTSGPQLKPRAGTHDDISEGDEEEDDTDEVVQVHASADTLDEKDGEPGETEWKELTLTVLVATIDAQWEGMGDVGSARYEPALLPPCPTIRVLSYSN